MKVLEEQSGFTTLQAFITRTKKNLMPIPEKKTRHYGLVIKKATFIYIVLYLTESSIFNSVPKP